MIKNIFLLSVVSVLLLANSLEVQDNKVTLLYNGMEENLTIGTYELKKDIHEVCFKGGKGKVIFNQTFHLSNSSEISCYELTSKKGFTWSNLYAYFKNTGSDGGHAVARKAITVNETETTELIVPSNEKYIRIEMQDLGPLPIKLFIYNNQHEVIKEFVNQDDSKTMFKIETALLKNGYTLELSNYFDDILMRGIIKFQ